jgi:hypothetical protein
MRKSVLKPFIFTITLLLAPASNALSANQEIITDDGREVMLKDDGTWVYRSTDRFANTTDGRRVRLKEDGSWQYTVNTGITSGNQSRTTKLGMKLQKVVIEKYTKKMQKNKRIKTQTVFYVNLMLPQTAKNHINIKKTDATSITVKDNSGKSYPIFSIKPDTAILKPGTDLTITIRANGSPLFWDNDESMEVVFNPGIFGIQEPISLSQKIITFDKKDVDGFEKSH